MKYFRIGFSCGCGESAELITASSLEEAVTEAYNCAVEDYHSYEGYHGVRDMTQIAEEMFGDPDSGDSYDMDSLTESEYYEVEMAYEEAIENEEVIKKVKEMLKENDALLSERQKIKYFKLVPDEWTAENELLTAALKLKRPVIFKKYLTDIQRMFSMG